MASLKSRFPAWWDAVAPVFEHEHAHGASDAWDGARRAVASSGLSSGDIPAVYIGFDPTADSLHVGNMLQMSALRALQASGFRPLVLVRSCPVCLCWCAGAVWWLLCERPNGVTSPCVRWGFNGLGGCRLVAPRV